MSLGSNLKALREQRGWSRQRLSEELGGFSTSYLHYVEHDEVLPSVEKLTEIVNALGGDPGPFVRERNELELGRLGHDARTTVFFEEKFGTLTEEELKAAERAVQRVRNARKARPKR